MSGLGSSALKRHRQGKSLTRNEAILAKCSDCCCDYSDGRFDCGIARCPLHPWMPYRGQQEPPEEEV